MAWERQIDESERPERPNERIWPSRASELTDLRVQRVKIDRSGRPERVQSVRTVGSTRPASELTNLAVQSVRISGLGEDLGAPVFTSRCASQVLGE